MKLSISPSPPMPGPAARALAVVVLLWGVATILAPAPAPAQDVPMPTSEQLEALRALPEADRAQAMRSLGLEPGDEGSAQAGFGDRGSDAFDRSNPLLQPGTLGGAVRGGENNRLQAESTIIVRFELNDAAEAEVAGMAPYEQQRYLDTFPRSLSGMRTYELDRYGVLHLLNALHIPLAGLEPVQAARRIESEPGLGIFNVSVALLPLEDTGPDALELFGMEFFTSARALLVDPATTPVPGNYVVGPGDVIAVTLFGADDARYALGVDRDGVLVLPEFGPIAVAGLSLDVVREEITTRIREQLIGVNASVTIERLRAIQIFVLGDVRGPGAYTVDGLTTMTNALLLSGGVRPNGSMRQVALKRNGRTVTRLDLYDLLLRGDAEDDLRLQNGDVVFVPPIGPTVGVEGMVNRPARYELARERTVGEVLRLAGGLTADAERATARLERISENGIRTVIAVDLASSQGQAQPVRNGDILRIRPVSDVTQGVVTLAGHVRAPGDYQWTPGMRLTDLVPSPYVLNPLADTRYVLVQRTTPQGLLEVRTADLDAALKGRRGPADMFLRSGDVVTIFEVSRDRSGIIGPLLAVLRDQTAGSEADPIVSVQGSVEIPGEYPYTPGMRVSDMLRAGGGLAEYAYERRAELARQINVDGEYARTEFIAVDLDALLAGDPAADVAVRPRDYLTIKRLPEAREREIVRLRGEVRFPGDYPLQRGETLASIIDRAGGLTDFAFPQGSVFTRAGLRQREQDRFAELANRLEVDLAAAAVRTAQETERGAGDAAQGALLVGQQLLQELRDTEPVGRLVIDLERVVEEGTGTSANVLLQDGDELYVPAVAQEVTVIGEVQSPTSLLWDPSLDRDDYISLAGGFTPDADKKRVYVVRADGSVIVKSGSRWFRRPGVQIEVGDTIVVPLDADRLRPLALATSITTIMYQLGLAVAAATAFNR